MLFSSGDVLAMVISGILIVAGMSVMSRSGKLTGVDRTTYACVKSNLNCATVIKFL